MNDHEDRHRRELARQLDEAQATIAALVAGQIDAAGVDVDSGTPKLLARALEALRESEARFREQAAQIERRERILTSTLSFISDFAYIYDRDGRFLFVNQPLLDLWGIKLEDAVGKNFFDLGYPDDLAAQLQREIETVFETRMGLSGETPYTSPTGVAGYYEYIFSPAFAPDGRVEFVAGTTRDITERKRIEAELETEHARLVAAQAVASIGSWETELTTLATVWSAETHRIFETTPEHFHPTHAGFLQLVHPEDRSAVGDAFTRSIEDCSSGAVEHRLPMPDGRIKFVEERWRVVCNEQGAPVRAIGTCQDITDRRRAQDAIRTQAHMLDQIGQAVIATDPAGYVTYANRFAGELYGWTPVEMLGRLITELTVPQATRTQGQEIMARLQRGETWSGEFQVQSRQGRVFPAHVTDSPVLDERGDLIGIIGISTDISARKQAEDEARLKDTLIRMAGRITHTGGWAIEFPGERIFWSDEVFDILEFTRGNTPTLAEALTLYPAPWRDKMVSAMQACREDGMAFDLEVEVLTAKGARKWVRVSAEAQRDAGSIPRIHGAFQDITEHKHLEQQYLRAQRMESIGLLAGGIAHDLNNVLAPILMSIGLLHRDEHDAERIETLVTIEASAKRGAAMVGRLLSFARGDDGQREEVQVPPLIRDLATIVRDTFPKNIAFEHYLDPNLWTLEADATQLHQLLLNLCVNARDAMPSGGRITLTADNIVLDEAFAAVNIDAHSGPYVTIVVEDTGTGISKEIIDKIFDPFFTTKDIGKGTGLGLATSLAIVTGHQGFLRVSSNEGAGTRFDVYLPAQTTRATPAEPVPAVVHSRSAGEMVLVVDDEEGIRQIAKRILEKYGYCVLLASDGAEAIAMYQQHQSDIAVVLTDMMMPMMDGAATIKELVALNPQVRIIAVSGLTTDARAAGVAAARVIHFLSKPYTAETLLTAVRAALPPGRG